MEVITLNGLIIMPRISDTEYTKLTSEAKLESNARWAKNNPEVKQYNNKKSAARSSLKKAVEIHDREWIIELEKLVQEAKDKLK